MVTADEFLADVAAVYIGHGRDGAFGSGRLIAPGLILTAGHVVDYPSRERPARTGWKVCLVRERTNGAWESPPHSATLLWRAPKDLDLALLRVSETLKPTLKLVFTSYEGNGSIDGVDATGFPTAWNTNEGPLSEYKVRGSFRIATQSGRYPPYTWTVATADNPRTPNAWQGMSGAAVCLEGLGQTIYILGVLEEIPESFPNGLLQVARLSHAFTEADFINYLKAALEAEPHIERWGSVTRGPVPSESAPTSYIDRPEFTGPLLVHLLSDNAVSRGRAMISVVHGMGGFGKTTVARWLIWRPEIEQCFPDGRIWVTLGSEPVDALTIINDWISLLDTTPKPKATEEAARAELTTLLENRSVLFVIDDVWPGRSIEVAKALMVASPKCRFLVTTRFPVVADDREMDARTFPLDEMTRDQAVALTVRALGRKLSATDQHFAEKLSDAVGGNPLALELATARIKEGQPWDALLDSLTAEIGRLEALEEVEYPLIAEAMTDEARRKHRSVQASLLLSVRYLARSGQRLFAWLGIIAEHATITPRMAATLWSTSEDTALKYLHTLHRAGLLSTTGDFYRMHKLLQDLARKVLAATEFPTREGDIAGFGTSLRNGVEQFLQNYQAKASNGLWHSLPEDGYIHSHLLRHLEQVNWESEIGKLLWEESANGLCGWYWARERLGQTAGFLADVRQVWDWADRTLTGDPSEERRARALALQLHCALITASINSLSAGIPSEVLAGAVNYAVMQAASAAALARQHPIRIGRAFGLLAVVNGMPRAQQLGMLDEVLASARCIDLDWVRAEVLAKVVPLLHEEMRDDVLREALSVARDISTEIPWQRAKALATIAPLLPADQALVVAREIEDPMHRAEALAGVAPLLTEEARHGVLIEALSLARDISTEIPWQRAEALATIAPLLTDEVQRGVTDEALSAARGIERAEQRAKTLAKVAPLLAEKSQHAVLDEALSAARGIERAERRAEALAKVAPLLPAEEALTVARGIEIPRERAKALAEVAPHQTKEVQCAVLREALAVARRIDDGRQRSSALAMIAWYLPKESRPEVMDEALSIARTIADARQRSRALVEMAQRLPEGDVSDGG